MASAIAIVSAFGTRASWTFSFSFFFLRLVAPSDGFFVGGLLLLLLLLGLAPLRAGELDRAAEREAVERVRERPGDRLAAVGPAHVSAGVVGEAVDRDGSFLQAHLGRLLQADPRQRRHEDVVARSEHDPVPSGDGHDVVHGRESAGCGRLSVPSSRIETRSFLGSSVGFLGSTGSRKVETRPVGVPEGLRVELQPHPFAELDGRDGPRVAAGRVEHRRARRLLVLRLAAAELEARPLASTRCGRPSATTPGWRSGPAPSSAGRARFPPRPAAFQTWPPSASLHETYASDLPSAEKAGAYSRRGKRGIVLREPPGRAGRLSGRELLEPDAAEGFEGDPPPVRRLARPTEDFCLDRSRLDLLLPGDERRRRTARSAAVKGIGASASGGDVEQRQLPFVGKDERLAVRA